MYRVPLWLSCLSFVAAAIATDAPRPWSVAFEPLTEERIAKLPANERPAWEAYWARSVERAKLDSGRGQEDFSPDKPLKTPPAGGAHIKGLQFEESRSWYTTDDARAVADHVVVWQTPTGGWIKGGDYTRLPIAADQHHDVWKAGTFDNDATTSELEYLAEVIDAADQHVAPERLAKWRESFLHGIDYILAAQYPNGGFPQIYPLAGGYHDAITFNDNAMVRILELFTAISRRDPLYRFVPADVAEKTGHAVDRGIACILATQIKEPNGQTTVWCQQNDALTLQPCAARNFEPAAACSAESASLVLFLMSLPRQTPPIAKAISDAATWFRAHAMHDVTWDRHIETGTGLVPRVGGPNLWARFYEIGTGRPIFGDRDRTIHYLVTEISKERRTGYQWFGSKPDDVLKRYDKPRKLKP